MDLGEKCGLCREEIPDEEGYFKVVKAEWCWGYGYSKSDIILICLGCFTDIFLSGIRLRKGTDLRKVADADED